MPTRTKDIRENNERKTEAGTVRRILSPDQLLTTSELMQFLKVKHRKTIYALIKTGLPKIMVGRRFRFVKEEIMEFLRNRSETAKTATDHE